MSPTEHTLIPVPFHTDTLFLVQHQGEPFVPLRPIVQNLGLDWKSQHAKITADSERWGVVLITTPSGGGRQETICLPLNRIFGFLMTIEPSRVKEKVRPKVIEYQRHCDKVLADYWTKGYAISQRFSADEQAITIPVKEYVALLKQENELLKIKLETPVKIRKALPLSANEIAEVHRMHADHFSNAYIARKLNRSRAAVGYVLKPKPRELQPLLRNQELPH